MGTFQKTQASNDVANEIRVLQLQISELETARENAKSEIVAIALSSEIERLESEIDQIKERLERAAKFESLKKLVSEVANLEKIEGSIIIDFENHTIKVKKRTQKGGGSFYRAVQKDGSITDCTSLIGLYNSIHGVDETNSSTYKHRVFTYDVIRHWSDDVVKVQKISSDGNVLEEVERG